jgi:glycine/D-amino acid oxidase-like deaminating enzyme
MSFVSHASVSLRVAIAGGGVIGLGIGWRLATAGCSVDVFDKGEAGRAASHAAAGMLAAGVEVEPGEESLLPLNRHSQALWPGLAAELKDASGVDVELRTEGTMVVALGLGQFPRLEELGCQRAQKAFLASVDVIEYRHVLCAAARSGCSVAG